MRRIWNRPALPVWSLSTNSPTGEGNMNIATYVTAISLEPKLFTIAVYEGTQTLVNLLATRRCLAQLLTEELCPVVRVCGKQSGKTIAKLPRLQKRYALSKHNELWHFAKAAGFVELVLEDERQVGGDHRLCTFSVAAQVNLTEAPILTTDYLRSHGYIR